MDELDEETKSEVGMDLRKGLAFLTFGSDIVSIVRAASRAFACA